MRLDEIAGLVAPVLTVRAPARRMQFLAGSTTQRNTSRVGGGIHLCVELQYTKKSKEEKNNHLFIIPFSAQFELRSDGGTPCCVRQINTIWQILRVLTRR